MCLLSRDMLKIILSVVTDLGLISWIFLYLIVSGTQFRVTIGQAPVLTTALGHDVLIPCQLNISLDEKMVTPPVLYWLDSDNVKLWKPAEKYKERVDLLDDNPSSLNKSILLKNVQWADSGKTYLCKFSIYTDKHSFRRNGNESFLMVYDTMIFNRAGHNDSLLCCEMNVTRDPRFVLSIFHNGSKAQTVDSAPGDNDTALPYVTLTETIPLSSGGTYECHLYLNEDLITKNIFHYPVAGNVGDAADAGDAGKNVSEKNSTTVWEPTPEEFQEPWLLYAALLMVPTTTLLVLLIGMMCRS